MSSKKMKNVYENYYKITKIKKYEIYYTKLFLFETELKNAISNAIKSVKGEKWLTDSLFTFILKKNVTLGFWVKCFCPIMVNEFWFLNPNLIIDVFPYLLNKERSYSIIHEELGKIKYFRNNIFHFDINKINPKDITNIDTLIDKYTFGMTGIKMTRQSISNPAIFMKSEACSYIKNLKDVQNFEKISNLFHNISNNISQYIDCAFKINDYSFYCKISFMPDQGGAQDNQYKDIHDFLHHAGDCNEKNTIFLAICDGDYYLNKDSQTGDETKLDRLKSLTHNKTSFVLSIEELKLFLEKFI